MTPPTDQDFDIFAAYLDDELSSAERAALEARLAAEPNLAAELNTLRRTKRVLRAAPRLKVPRNFTLDPAVYGRRTPWWARYRMMQAAGALGTLAASLLIVFSVMLMGASRAAPTSSSIGVAVQPTTAFLAATVTAVPQQGQNNFAAQPTSGADMGRRAETAAGLAFSPTPLPTATITTAGTVAAPMIAASTLSPATLTADQAVGGQAPLPAQPQPVVPPQAAPQSGAADGASAAGPATQPLPGNSTGGSSGEVATSTLPAAAAKSAQSPTQTRPRSTSLPSPTQRPRSATPRSAQTAAGALAAAPTRSPTAIQPMENMTATPLASLRPPATATQQVATQQAMQQRIVSPPPERLLSPTPTPTAQATVTVTVAARDDQSDKGQAQAPTSAPIPTSQLLLVGGIGLFVFSASLFAIGTLRSRL